QFWMRLRAHIERVNLAWKLYVLNQGAVWRRPGEGHAGIRYLRAVAVVNLVAVTVTLGDLGCPVKLFDDGTGSERGRVHSEAHGAAQVATGDDVDLLGHRCDHRVLGLRVELGGGCPRQPGEVARVLDDHGLQAEAESEHRNAVLASEL